MSTSLVLPASFLKDLVRIQGEELIRVCQQLTDALNFNATLSLDLERAKEEIRQLRGSSELPEAHTQARSSASEAISPLGAAAGSNSGTENTAEGSEGLGDETLHLQPDDVDHLRPFCLRRSPYEYLKPVRGLLKPNSILVPVAAEFLFDPNKISEGFLVKPSHRLRSRHGQLEVVEYDKWKKKAGKIHELLACHKGNWYYFGGYKVVSTTLMEVREFHNMPRNTKKQLFKLAASPGAEGVNVVDRARAMFASGEMQVVKIELRRVAFHAEIEQGLLEAVAAPVGEGSDVSHYSL